MVSQCGQGADSGLIRYILCSSIEYCFFCDTTSSTSLLNALPSTKRVIYLLSFSMGLNAILTKRPNVVVLVFILSFGSLSDTKYVTLVFSLFSRFVMLGNT